MSCPNSRSFRSTRHAVSVMRRAVRHFSMERRRGHLRGRVTAVGRQLEFLVTTLIRHPLDRLTSQEAVIGRGAGFAPDLVLTPPAEVSNRAATYVAQTVLRRRV